MRKCNGMTAILVGLSLVFIEMHAQALITALTPLQAVLKQSTFIVTTNVESVGADKPEMVLVVEEHLKGKLPLRRLAILLQGDAEAKKETTFRRFLSASHRSRRCCSSSNRTKNTRGWRIPTALRSGSSALSPMV